MEFLVIPDTYYDNLRARLKDAPIKIKEDLNVVSWNLNSKVAIFAINYGLHGNLRVLLPLLDGIAGFIQPFLSQLWENSFWPKT